MESDGVSSSTPNNKRRKLNSPFISNQVASTSAVTLDALFPAIDAIQPSTPGLDAMKESSAIEPIAEGSKQINNDEVPGEGDTGAGVEVDVVETFDEDAHEEKLKIWDLFAEEYHDGRLNHLSALDLSFDLERLDVDDDDELWLMLSLFSARQ
jgi:hypothetical protein